LTDVTCYGAARRVWARRGGFETRPPVFLQDIIGVYQPTSGDVGLRCIKSAVQGFAIVVVEPVAGILGHPIDLGPFSMQPGGARGRAAPEALVERSHEAALDYAPATAKGYSSAH
jgi:hypothetical protein